MSFIVIREPWLGSGLQEYLTKAREFVKLLKINTQIMAQIFVDYSSLQGRGSTVQFKQLN